MSSLINHKRSISGNQPPIKKINNLKTNPVVTKNPPNKESITQIKMINKANNISQTKILSFKPPLLSQKNPFLSSQKQSSIQYLYDKNIIQTKKENKREISLNISDNPTRLNISNNNIVTNINSNNNKSSSSIGKLSNNIPFNKVNNKLKERPSTSQIKLKRNVKKMDISNQSLSVDSFTTGITEKTSRLADKSMNISSRRLNNSNLSRENKTSLTITMSSERVSLADKIKNKASNFLSCSPDNNNHNTNDNHQRNVSPSFFYGNNETNKSELLVREDSKKKISLNNKLKNNNTNIFGMINNKDKGNSPFKLVKNDPKKMIFREMNTSPLIKKAYFTKKLKSNLNKSMIGLASNRSNQPNNSAINIMEKLKKNISIIHEQSKTGFSGEGCPKKINQDNFFIYKNFLSNIFNHAIYFGVCDGHGAFGHEVSQFLIENLPKTIDFEVKRNFKEKNLKKIIEEVFVATNFKLINETLINSHFSGSTCVSVIYTQEKLICANVGDSRAILGRYVNDTWKSHNLSRDHKPSDKDESTRILSMKGRIEAYRDEYDDFVGPSRVWLMDEDIPGLAMSRSFGDQVAASVGVICEPEIMEWEFTKEDKFMVIGSDGVFEFIDSDEIVDIVKNYYVKNDIQGCVETLIEESSKRWMREEQVIDDITVIVVFFD